MMKKHFLICINNAGYEASLDVKKIYEYIIDKSANAHNQVRVIDESGEDYLYSQTFFSPIRLPHETREKLNLLHA